MRKPRPHRRLHQNGHDQRHGIGQHQAHKAPRHALPGVIKLRMTTRRQAGSRQKATQHQKHLHRHARIFLQPGHEAGQNLAQLVGHGAIESEVVPDDGRAGQALGAVDKGAALNVGHERWREMNGCARFSAAQGIGLGKGAQCQA